MSFNKALQLSHYQEIHNLLGNWEVYSGEFMGSGRAQVLLYDRGSGDGQFLVFSRDLSLSSQKSYSVWGKNRVLYTGNCEWPALRIRLSDPASHHRTFILFVV